MQWVKSQYDIIPGVLFCRVRILMYHSELCVVVRAQKLQQQ